MRTFAALLLALACVSPLRAEDLTGRFAVGGAFGGGVPVGTAWVNDNASIGPVLGGFLRYGLNKNLSVGLSYDNLAFSKRNIRVQPILVNAYYNLKPDSTWNPNIHLGLGGSQVNRDESGQHTSVTGKLGVGADYFVHKNVAIGGFMDYLLAAYKSGTNHEVHSLLFGLTAAYWFGGCQEPAQAAAPAPAPAPVVAAAPAPAPAPVIPAPVPAAAPIAAPPAKGEKRSIDLLIKFDTAKSVVKDEYNEKLGKVAEFLKAYPEVRAEIEGHTDSMGDKGYNMKLSQERAAAVRQALISRFGAPADRLTSKGYGPTKPIADNKTEAGRSQNRRVIASFTGI
ncbi:MAG: OmpA family protein [Elusimicrobia bacterium]|nr:OmpA family protein [Elusimicrobiota bacterium]